MLHAGDFAVGRLRKIGPSAGRQGAGNDHLSGKPVAKAAISFIPEKAGTVPALATTDENGEYVLGTYGAADGAPVGPCRVAISLTGASPPLPEHLAKAEAAAETLRMPGKPLIPKRYFSPDTSGLKEEVLSGKDNVFDFKLEGELTP